MATPVKVYGPPLSTAVSRVLACLLEKEVDYQLISVNMAKGEHKKPDYLKIQPFGQVPAFEDEHISLFESRAICRYICDKYADEGNKGLYGMNPLAKASIDKWLEAEGQSFSPPSSTLVFQLAFAPRMKLKQDEGVVRQNVGECFGKDFAVSVLPYEIMFGRILVHVLISCIMVFLNKFCEVLTTAGYVTVSC